jgi:uncharacterized membrane protein YedE/YeeE
MPEVAVHNAVLGGFLIACGVTLLLVGCGRIAGIGGAFSNTLKRSFGEQGWRPLFLLGIVAGGGLASLFLPEQFSMSEYDRSMPLVVASGFLMGFGGRMCNGCTSGHGVCGISRLSVRSIVATATFFGTTLAAVFVLRHVVGVL